MSQSEAPVPPSSSPAAARPAGELSLRDILGVELPIIEICDVGAMNEGTDRYAALVDQNLANVSGFEPNPDEFKKLQSRHLPRRQYFPFFLGKGGPGTFHLTAYPGCSSLYEPDPAVIDLLTSFGAGIPKGNFTALGAEAVLTTCLDDVPGLPVPDYLKIDVQGAELDVLQGAPTALKRIVVLELEVEFIALYRNQPLFGDIQIYLRDRGFVLHKFIDVVGRTFRPVIVNDNDTLPMSQVVCADAIFIRDFAKLTDYSDDQLLKAATILHDVYCSYDLVLLLLKAYDQRRGTAHHERLGKALAENPHLPILYMNPKLKN